ncbi:ribosome-associated protein [Glaciecola punicea ACAM 611]|uniref:Ribosomal silencing factor RsfS n=1 Tax=Glaciecola punicea ACAM 611 TaxID=1121923 RepID=H5TAC4_9ALTE|nr:ribosome silencing factor [Glaciecola punicea]GAB55251.1 ribosome-associated protein [Glaciecola punicea ACAM 611]
MNQQEFTNFVIDKVDDMKAKNITVIDVTGKSSVTDTLVICSGTSKRHVSAIAENVIVECKQARHAPLSVEGKAQGEWVLVDLGDIVLHVMQDETRDFYQLEKLWQ